MQDLIERLEKATGPDGWLDCNIREAVEGWRNVGGGYREWPDGRRESYDYGYAKPYTSSIDAAMTLVPEGYAIDAFQIWPGEPSRLTILGTRREPFGKDRRMAWVHSSSRGRWEAQHANTAIAICIAALKARATDAALKWELSEDAKDRLAEIDRHIVR